MAQPETRRATGELHLTRQENGLKGPVQTVETTFSHVELDDARTKYIERSLELRSVSYDRQGKKTEEYSGYRKGDSSNKGKKIFVYDSQGRLQEIVVYDHAEKIETKFIAKHDNDGRMVTLDGSFRFKPGIFTGDGPPIELKTSFGYGVKGKTIEQTVGGEDRELPPLFRTISTFGQSGDLLEQKFYAAGLLESHRKYIYDAKRLIRMNETIFDVHYGKGAPRPPSFAREFYSYDQHGNLVETKRYGSKTDGSGRVLETWILLVYEFDTVGNWVKKSQSGWVYSGKPYQKGVSKIVPRQIKKRVITYYE